VRRVARKNQALAAINSAEEIFGFFQSVPF